MAKQYARRQLVRGEDGLLNVAYIDIATGLPIDRGSISDYEIVDANAGSYWGDKGNRRKKDDEEDDKKKKKKKEESIFDTNGDKPTQGIQSPGSEASKYTAYINATPTTKFSTTTSNSTDVTEPNTTTTSETTSSTNPDVVAPATEATGPVRSLDQTMTSGMNTGYISSVPNYESRVTDTSIANPNETSGFVDYSVQPTSTRTLGLMEEVNRPVSESTYSRQNWTDEDKQAVAQTIAGEIDQRRTDLSSPEGIREVGAIITSIENRAIARGISPSEVVSQPKQYSSWNAPMVQTTMANYEQNPDMFNGFVSDYLSDPNSRQGNFTSYHSVDVKPGWSSSMQDVETIGPHTFGYLPEFNLPENVDVMGNAAPGIMSGIINDNVQSTAGLMATPGVPVDKVQTTSVPNYTESGYYPSLNPNPAVGVNGNTNAELGFSTNLVDVGDTTRDRQAPAQVPTRSVSTSQWDPSGVNKPGMGFGDYFNPENLSYDPSYESETLSDNQDVGRVNSMVSAGLQNRDLSSLNSPITDYSTPNYEVTAPSYNDGGFHNGSPGVSSGMSGVGDGFGNPYGPQGFGPDPSGANGMGGFGSGMGGDVGGPGGPNTVGGYFDGGFHSTTPSYTPSTPTYDDGGFHKGFISTTNPAPTTIQVDPDRFTRDTPTYDDGGFHNTAPGSTSESPSGGNTSGGGWGGW